MQKAFVGSKLRQLRRDRGQTQAEMATVLGISAAYVNMLEKNQRSLSVSVLMTLSDNYGVDWKDLVSDKSSAILADLRAAIQDLEGQGAQGYVLDLRSNPGGLLEASIDIARHWLNKGTIVSTRTREGIRDIRRATGSAITDKPMVVLIDQGSASASEILSGALQENERAQLVGQKTFGKGLVQAVRGLSDGSGMTVTIAKYLTPNGTDIHKNGIQPDISAEMSEKEIRNFKIEDLGTSRDSQYRVAETALTKALKEVNQVYQPGNANLQAVF